MQISIIGATGLVGGFITRLLLESESTATLHVFTRRPTGLSHAKLQEHIVDFADMSAWQSKIGGDALVSALGTTRSAAGGFEGQRKVDYGIQYAVAKAAAENGVPHLVLISSPHADPESKHPYRRMKGELERDVNALPFGGVSILQPGPLKGARDDRNFSALAVDLLDGVSPLLSEDCILRPITGERVAEVASALAGFSGRETLRLGVLHQD